MRMESKQKKVKKNHEEERIHKKWWVLHVFLVIHFHYRELIAIFVYIN